MKMMYVGGGSPTLGVSWPVISPRLSHSTVCTKEVSGHISARDDATRRGALLNCSFVTSSDIMVHWDNPPMLNTFIFPSRHRPTPSVFSLINEKLKHAVAFNRAKNTVYFWFCSSLKIKCHSICYCLLFVFNWNIWCMYYQMWKTFDSSIESLHYHPRNKKSSLKRSLKSILFCLHCTCIDCKFYLNVVQRYWDEMIYRYPERHKNTLHRLIP